MILGPSLLGVLATLLPVVLAKERQETWQLKAHVILVNALAFAQTVISSMPIFNDGGQGKHTGAVCWLANSNHDMT